MAIDGGDSCRGGIIDNIKLGRQNLFVRCMSTVSKSSVNKSTLGSLRKKTGFSFVNCKNALLKFDNNIEKAETWLREQAQKEGWAKATKLQGRPMSQGLIGVMYNGNDKAASLVEVNCETDFVAVNQKFQDLVHSVADVCYNQGSNANNIDKVEWDTELLSKLQLTSDKTVADQVALTVGELGENIAVRRAAYIQAPNHNLLGYYVHVAGPNVSKHKNCLMGKYAALVNFTAATKQGNALGQQLCQHIVGMNPKSINPVENDDKEKLMEKDLQKENVPSKERPEAPEESALIRQEFMLDTTLTVNDVLIKNQATVHDYIRYECGEVLDEQKNSIKQEE